MLAALYLREAEFSESVYIALGILPHYRILLSSLV